MKKVFYMLSLFMLALVTNCTTDSLGSGVSLEIEEKGTIVNKETINVNNIREPFEDEIEVITQYLYTLDLKLELFEDIKAVEYTNLYGKSFVLDYKGDDHLYSNSLILIFDENNDITSFINYSKEQYNEYISIIKTDINEEKWFRAEINNLTDEIINIEVYGEKEEKTLDNFVDCVKIAVTSCVNDGECAFICGIIWKYCLGSIGIACALL